MKKLIFIITTFLSVNAFSQGTINIFNFSSYDLRYTLLGNNLSNTAGGCSPNLETSVTTTILSGDPATGNPVTYTSYNNALVQTTNVFAWSPNSGVTNYYAPGPYGILNVYSTTTKWLGSKFHMHDPVTGNSTPNGGFSIGGHGCGASYVFVPTVGGTAPYPIFGEWFTSSGETYFIVQ